MKNLSRRFLIRDKVLFISIPRRTCMMIISGEEDNEVLAEYVKFH
jgi:hypothetical protein